MFGRLQKKWKVSGWRFTLIIITFALGGMLTGYIGKRGMSLTTIESPWLYIPVYIILITFLWPLLVLLVSIPTGQFRFFLNYLRKIFSHVGLWRVASEQLGGGSRESGVGSRKLIVRSLEATPNPVRPGHPGGPKSETRNHHVAIFASGAGSNAQKIIQHFRNHSSIKVGIVGCNKPGAGVLQIAQKENIPILMIDKEKFFNGNGYVDELMKEKIDLIALAGFLWKIPQSLITAYRGRIINIHPALLPKYGGKGFYGEVVHKAVIDSGEKESGITIHYVDEHYDNGDIILQKKCAVLENDTPESLARRIHALEHAHYPEVIEQILVDKLTS